MNKRGNPNWQKGKSGNPKGRGTKRDEDKLIQTIKDAMKAYGGEKGLWEKIAKAANEGDSRRQEFILNYLYGKPAQKLDGEFDFISPINIQIIDAGNGKDQQ